MDKSKAPALAKGLDIIDLIRSKGSLSFIELQEMTQDNPASLSRYLHTLLEKNYIMKNHFQKYELGLKLIDLKDNRSIWPQLKKKIFPLLKKINETYGATVLLIAYTQDTYVVIDKVIALDNLGMMEKNTVGINNFSSMWTNLYYENLQGKSIVNFIQSHLEPSIDPSTIQQTTDLMTSVITKGYLTHLSNNKKIYRIGIPITYQGRVIATIGIGTFINQLNKEELAQMTNETLELVHTLSMEL